MRARGGDSQSCDISQQNDGTYQLVNVATGKVMDLAASLWRATQLGADPARLRVWSNWIAAMWAER